ncbi:MAG: precorrin-2 C(20)-methyltransferase [Solirubrobacterales bacterium]|nr:precorrin-2 C(20)-methyltransferase [Solirubrobacterales bacterium]
MTHAADAHARHTGRLYGVGVGPGDPELMTVKARRIIERAPVIAYPGAAHGSSIARSVADPYLGADKIEVGLRYPVTTGTIEHPGGYEAALAEFYDDCAAQLAVHLDAGRDVAVLCEGDPFLYGSYMYLHDRLAGRYPTEVIPGVASFSAAAAASGTPLVRRDDVLTILPGTLSPDVLAARLRTSDAAVVMKLGRTFPAVREATERAGLLHRGVYVERASFEGQRVVPMADVNGTVPYMSLVLVPAERWPRRPAPDGAARGLVSVVGLGPAGPDWLTPEAHAELAGADVLVGYETYLRRVPQRHGQRRLVFDNRSELDRATQALRLAAAGERVAVVSSGDPGVFAMAAAVLEAVETAEKAAGTAREAAGTAREAAGTAEEAAVTEVEIRVVPGLSAMQAAAARVGAPLGHDFCVISLSDQLKDLATIERRLDAAASADLVVALYNPASRTRRAALQRGLEVLRRHRAPETPVIVARAVGCTEEAITVTTLADVQTAVVDMRTLMIVGSSQTRILPSGNGRPRVYTPRSYPSYE